MAGHHLADAPSVFVLGRDLYHDLTRPQHSLECLCGLRSVVLAPFGGVCAIEPNLVLSEVADARPLWRISVLLNAAVELGRTLEHYSISQNSRVEATIRRMSEINPGRGASAEGKAVLKIIKAYIIDEKGIAPTSKDLLNFLKAEKDSKSDARPMTVASPSLERGTQKCFLVKVPVSREVCNEETIALARGASYSTKVSLRAF